MNAYKSTLHLIWLGGEPPAHVYEFSHTWKHFREVVVHTERTLRSSDRTQWIFEHTNDAGKLVKEVDWYTKSMAPSGRVLAAKDFVRLVVLDAFGGVYSDWDVEWRRPIEDTGLWPRQDQKALVGFEDENWLCNAVIASPAGNRAIESLIQTYKGADYNDLAMRQALRGPVALTDCMRQFPSWFETVQPEVFFPLHWGSREMRESDKTVCVHMYTDSPTAPGKGANP